MLNSGNKIRALRDKKKNILTLVSSEKKILNETKNQDDERRYLQSDFRFKVHYYFFIMSYDGFVYFLIFK